MSPLLRTARLHPGQMPQSTFRSVGHMAQETESLEPQLGLAARSKLVVFWVIREMEQKFRLGCLQNPEKLAGITPLS